MNALIPLILTLLMLSPATSYDLTSEPLSQRQQICNNQVSTCKEVCTSTTANKCDVKTMQFQCVCSNNQTPNDTVVTFPVPFFQCQGSLKECNAKCSKDAPGSQACIDGCTAQYKCGNIKTRNGTDDVQPGVVNINKGGDTMDSGATVEKVSGLLGLVVASGLFLFQ